ncbi:MAG TPA: hypothetical protein VK177_02020 [Flavobacteriales bacterium]|nr:hypothetical protein [Flavobacteriales bacterium]
MASKTEQQKLAELKQHANYLLNSRPSVLRTGTVILVLRIVCSLASVAAYIYGIYVLAKGTGKIYHVDVREQHWMTLDALEAGILLIVLGVLLNVIAALCRLIRNRNWYILESYEVIEWVGERETEKAV